MLESDLQQTYIAVHDVITMLIGVPALSMRAYPIA